MAFSFHGFGTSYYGKGDFHADGSYVTTKWLILGYLPLVPLESLRAQDDGTFALLVLQQLPVDLGQVLRTWIYCALLIALFIGFVAAIFSQALMVAAFGCAVLLPFALRFLSRRRAAQDQRPA